jgi:hypothetical protein
MVQTLEHDLAEVREDLAEPLRRRLVAVGAQRAAGVEHRPPEPTQGVHVDRVPVEGAENRGDPLSSPIRCVRTNSPDTSSAIAKSAGGGESAYTSSSFV